MSNKEEGYYYSYKLFKSIQEHNSKKLEILNDVMNDALQNESSDYIVNTCLDAIKVCEFLSKRLVVIEDIRKSDNHISGDKIALAGSEIEEIKELGSEIEEYEILLAKQNLSVSFH